MIIEIIPRRIPKEASANGFQLQATELGMERRGLSKLGALEPIFFH